MNIAIGPKKRKLNTACTILCRRDEGGAGAAKKKKNVSSGPIYTY